MYADISKKDFGGYNAIYRQEILKVYPSEN